MILQKAAPLDNLPGRTLRFIAACFKNKTSGSHTRRSNGEEIGRFVSWSVVEKGKAVSLLTVVDCFGKGLKKKTPWVIWAR